MIVFGAALQRAVMRGGEVEAVLLMRGEVGVFQPAQAGEDEGQAVFARVGGIEQAACGDLLDGIQERVAAAQQVEVGLGGVDPWGEKLGDDLGLEVGEVIESVALAGLGEVDQPGHPARTDECIFEVEVAVDGGEAALDGFLEPEVQLGKRVGQPAQVQTTDQAQ